MPVPRSEVYVAIDSERDYQERLWGPTETKGLHSISEFLLYMQDYLAEAAHIVSREGKKTAYPKALEVVRKITTMGVSCMEQHGAPLRLPKI